MSINCPITSGYQVPCRQISGVQNIYIAGVDGTFSVSPTKSLSSFYVSYEDTGNGGGDIYLPGTYTFDFNVESTNDNLYTTSDNSGNLSGNYQLPSYVTLSVKIVIGNFIDPDTPQPISATINTITNNIGMSKFYFYVSAIDGGSMVDTNYNDSAVIAATLIQEETYQIDNFSRHFYHFNQRLEQASFLESGLYGENGSIGSIGSNQKLELTIEGYDQTTKNIISVLNKTRLRSIIQDQSDNYYLVGSQNYLTVTTADGGLGKSFVDGVKTTLTFEGKELEVAYSLDNTVIFSGILIG
jgi:hypothetical protein